MSVKKIYRKLPRAQTRKGFAGNSRDKHGLQSNKFCTWKKIIDKGIENIPNFLRYGLSKIKNKNVKRTLTSDIANYVVEKTQNKAKNKLTKLFGGV